MDFEMKILYITQKEEIKEAYYTLRNTIKCLQRI